MSEQNAQDIPVISRKDLMDRVWSNIVAAFVRGDIDRAQSLERFYSRLEEMSR